MEIWNVYTLCCKDLERAPLPDIFFCVKNMTKMKYHTDVIVSRLCDTMILHDKRPQVNGQFLNPSHNDR